MHDLDRLVGQIYDAAVEPGRWPQVLELLSDFLARYPNCYPPLVLNITDGAATDGNPEEAAANLRHLASTDGNVLLFNAHVSAKTMRPIELTLRVRRTADPNCGFMISGFASMIRFLTA